MESQPQNPEFRTVLSSPGTLGGGIHNSIKFSLFLFFFSPKIKLLFIILPHFLENC